jgi:hypothetical protein
VAPAFERDARLVVLDRGELVFTDTAGASSPNELRGRALMRTTSQARRQRWSPVMSHAPGFGEAGHNNHHAF